MQLPKGVGLGYRDIHSEEILKTLPKVSFFEILGENYFTKNQARKDLLKLREHYPLAMHGVSLSIASAGPLDLSYLKNIKELANEIEPFLISEHLCWSQFGKEQTHDLMPFPYTEESLKWVSERVLKVQDELKRSLVLENTSSYVRFASSEMEEEEFLAELAHETGCKILLDLNNVYVNSHNFGGDSVGYLSGLPINAVVQFHLSGHSKYEDVLIDTHSAKVSQGVWDLYAVAKELWPEVPTIIEWDDEIPDFNVLLEEARKAEKVSPVKAEVVFGDMTDPTGEEEFKVDQEKLYQAVRGKEVSLENYQKSSPLSPELGLKIYRNAYIQRAFKVMKRLYPSLAFVTGDDFRDVVIDYLEGFAPTNLSLPQIGNHFEKYFRKKDGEFFDVPAAALADLALFEWTGYEAEIAELSENLLSLEEIDGFSESDWEALKVKATNVKTIQTKYEVDKVVESVSEGQTPEKPVKRDCLYVFNQKSFFELNDEEKEFWQKLQVGGRLKGLMGQPEQDFPIFKSFLEKGLIDYSL